MKFINQFKKIYLFSAIVVIGVLFLFFFSSEAQAACGDTSHNVLGWGWSDYVGWISLSCANSEAPSDFDFGVNVNTTSGEVMGWAWNDWGPGYWICFGSSCSGYGIPPQGNLEARYNSSTRQITGWAKFIDWGDDGWIKLSADDFSWGTKFFGSQSQGTLGENPPANNSSWAWNSGIGWIQWVPTVCSCGEWQNQGCGVGGCSENQMSQTRICSPRNCQLESQCVGSSGCLILDAPESLTAISPKCGEIILSWGQTIGADSFNIYKTLTFDGCADLNSTDCYKIEDSYIPDDLENPSYVDKIVIPRVDYYYCVASVKEGRDPVVNRLNTPTRTTCFPGTIWQER